MPVRQLVISPSASRWMGELTRPSVSERAHRLREQLGLPTDRPVIFSGHQASLWHAGIASKYIACQQIARACKGHGAWVVVDQDAEDFGSIEVPARDAHGRLVKQRVELVDERTLELVRAGAPACWIKPFAARDSLALGEGVSPACASIDAGLKQIAHVLTHAGGDSAGEQISRATAKLFEPNGCSLTHVLATKLAQTDAFAWLVEQMASDAENCHRLYNSAAQEFAEARIGALGRDTSGSPEMPLWRIDPRTGLRKRVYASELATLKPSELSPRALTLTALLRLFACDLFIHGLGGGATPQPGERGNGYDRICEKWIADWLKLPMARAIVVTATVTLEIDRGQAVTSEQAREAAQLARKAQHDPALLGDAEFSTRKRELLEAMNATKDKRAKGEIFAQIQSLTEQSRARNGDKLAQLRARADELERLASEHPIATDRTYAWPLHSQADLRELIKQIEQALA
jgi:hypothetical protein